MFLDYLITVGLMINSEKCEYLEREVKILGFQLGSSLVKPYHK